MADAMFDVVAVALVTVPPSEGILRDSVNGVPPSADPNRGDIVVIAMLVCNVSAT